jgi:predicted DNA binding CopG/RHH family protein
MKPNLPKLDSNEAAEAFAATSDLTDFDLPDMRTVRFEFQPKTERINVRLPLPLLEAVKSAAARAGIP